MFSSGQNSDGTPGAELKRALHCSCGHVVLVHDDVGCNGVTLRDTHCACATSAAAALEAGIRSFEGSTAVLRRYPGRHV